MAFHARVNRRHLAKSNRIVSQRQKISGCGGNRSSGSCTIRVLFWLKGEIIEPLGLRYSVLRLQHQTRGEFTLYYIGQYLLSCYLLLEEYLH